MLFPQAEELPYTLTLVISWENVVARFGEKFQEQFQGKRKAHFDSIPEIYRTVDGAKVKWMLLVLLDAIIFLLEHGSLIEARRYFHQQKILVECIAIEMQRVLEETLNTEPNKLFDLAYMKVDARVDYLPAPWETFTTFRTYHQMNTPTKAKQKFLLILDMLTSHPQIRTRHSHFLQIVNDVIKKVLDTGLIKSQNEITPPPPLAALAGATNSNGENNTMSSPNSSRRSSSSRPVSTSSNNSSTPVMSSNSGLLTFPFAQSLLSQALQQQQHLASCSSSSTQLLRDDLMNNLSTHTTDLSMPAADIYSLRNARANLLAGSTSRTSSQQYIHHSDSMDSIEIFESQPQPQQPQQRMSLRHQLTVNTSIDFNQAKGTAVTKVPSLNSDLEEALQQLDQVFLNEPPLLTIDEGYMSEYTPHQQHVWDTFMQDFGRSGDTNDLPSHEKAIPGGGGGMSMMMMQPISIPTSQNNTMMMMDQQTFNTLSPPTSGASSATTAATAVANNALFMPHPLSLVTRTESYGVEGNRATGGNMLSHGFRSFDPYQQQQQSHHLYHIQPQEAASPMGSSLSPNYRKRPVPTSTSMQQPAELLPTSAMAYSPVTPPIYHPGTINNNNNVMVPQVQQQLLQDQHWMMMPYPIKMESSQQDGLLSAPADASPSSTSTTSSSNNKKRYAHRYKVKK